MRPLVLLFMILGCTVTARAATFDLATASIDDIQAAMNKGSLTTARRDVMNQIK